MAASSHAPSLQTGEFIGGRYRVDGWLGRGGMAEVFRAWDEASGRAVAVKVLRRSVAQDAEAAERLRREGRVLAALRHPSIVGFEAAGTLPDGRVYLVMELLEGETLRARMEAGPMLPGELSPVLEGLASGLSAAHARGILHRDLKPDNIFLCDGDLTRVKILDFGVSKVLGLEQLTRTGQVLGTPRYMAPEQLQGALRFDARVDVYALGVVLHEALGGASPFDASGPAQLVPAILAGRAVPLRQRRPEISESLAEVVHRAMAVDLDTRFASVAALAHAWRRALHRPSHPSAPIERRAMPEEKTTMRGGRWGSSPHADVGEGPVSLSAGHGLVEASDAGERVGSLSAGHGLAAVSRAGDVPVAASHGVPVESLELPLRRSTVPRAMWIVLGAFFFLGMGAATGFFLSRRSFHGVGAAIGESTTPLESAAPSPREPSPGSVESRGAEPVQREAPARAEAPQVRLRAEHQAEPVQREASAGAGGATSDVAAVPVPSGELPPKRVVAPPSSRHREHASRRPRRRGARSRSVARAAEARASSSFALLPSSLKQASRGEDTSGRVGAAARARAAQQGGNWADCVRYATEAMHARASSSMLKLRADCRAKLGDTAGALADYHRFCRVAYDHPAISEVRAAARALGRPCP